MASFVTKYMIFLQVKTKHQRLSGSLQPLQIPELKQDKITMDFVWSLPTTFSKYDAIWVIMDRLTNSAQFLSGKLDLLLSKLCKLYVKEVVKLHGVPSSIVSNRDLRCTSRFWPGLQKALGMRLDLSIAHYPQNDGESKRTIQTLEDIFHCCVLHFVGNGINACRQ